MTRYSPLSGKRPGHPFECRFHVADIENARAVRNRYGLKGRGAQPLTPRDLPTTQDTNMQRTTRRRRERASLTGACREITGQCCQRETPVGGSAGVSEKDDPGFGGNGTVLLNQTAPQDRRFQVSRLHAGIRFRRPAGSETGLQSVDSPRRSREHVMIVGPLAKTMTGYPRTENPDPTHMRETGHVGARPACSGACCRRYCPSRGGS